VTGPVIPAVLGWSNPQTAGGGSVRLYALDQGASPRWAPDGGRTIERAITERDGGTFEGDRYLVVHLGDRFVSDELAARITTIIEDTLLAFTDQPQPPDLAVPAPPLVDRRPHSRACGIVSHEHGADCHSNCPTCGGRAES
jgi:hypothetical protein